MEPHSNYFIPPVFQYRRSSLTHVPQGGDLIFRGIDGAECARFLRAVKRYAQHQGKGGDDWWTLIYMKSCFSGWALRWLLGLDTAVQNNWTALQLAMLDKYPDDMDDPTIPFTVQAAVPPGPVPNPSLASKTGRIVVLGDHPSLTQELFISKRLVQDGGLCFTSNSEDALIVSIPKMAGHFFHIEFAAKPRRIGLQWLDGPALCPGPDPTGPMCVNVMPGGDMLDHAVFYPIQKYSKRAQIWEVTSEDKVLVRWYAQNTRPDFLAVAANITDKRLSFFCDLGAYLASNPSPELVEAHLSFEPYT